ncbi:hypothetical protein H5410_026883 [Solanum commersonii]|uniref:DUF7745 domain-containing protein n=1 Tax=Solanum commersonii TaxID=4109 RepID=A0A9J5Z0C7_SOLCO|nr:hypothetical protein H5410_026883 [Solanum commersonii]
MMTKVPRTLIEWWEIIRVAYENEVMTHLGSLTDLLNVEANKSLITLMIEFWQPATVTFQFTNFEITPTLEEISQIANLLLVGREPLAPRTTSGFCYLQSLGLRVGLCLQRVNEGWVKLDYLFKRLSRRVSYDRFQQKFFISRVGWERHRAIVFVMAFWDESWCTPEYYTWFMMGGILARPSCDGILGFTDTQRSNQIGTELFNLMHITTIMYHQVTPRSVDHLIQAVDDEPNEEMEKDPEEDPREPTEEMEEDSKGYSEYDPNLYDPRDGGVMHMENEPVPIVEDTHSKYSFIGFDKREDLNNWNGRSTNP